MGTARAVSGLLLFALLGCEPGRDVDTSPPPVAPAGVVQGLGPAGGRIGVTVFDSWNRTTIAGATVVCHESGATAVTDATGRASLVVPPPPFTITGGAAGFGLATVAGASASTVGLPLRAATPRSVSVRGTITNIADTTASRCEVNGGTGGLDPLLTALGSDTYQLTARAGRNFRVTALEIGASGLRNIALSPLQWKLPPHKAAATVDFAFPLTPPALSSASGSLGWPSAFSASTLAIRGLATLDLDDLAEVGDVTVGWGVAGGGGATYQLDYAPAVIAGLAPRDLRVEGVAASLAGTRLLARAPHAAGATAGSFAAVLNLTFPAPSTPTAPAGGIPAQGITPLLTWSGTVAAGCYRLSCTDQITGNRWDVWLPAPATQFRLPPLPPALQPRGLTAGNVTAWDVRAIHDAGLVWEDWALDRLTREPSGESLTAPEYFTP
ncbi:MAG: hypothetical protein ACYTGX_07650 [Planctomycetota bacterium]|jgi:hypothetical protein